MTLLDWKPSRRAIAAARLLLNNNHRPTINRRIAIIEALWAAPNAHIQEIARSASTRPRVVRNLLRRWQEQGISSLIKFGRPADSNADVLLELKQAIISVPLRSLAEVGQWIQQTKGLHLSKPTLRSYCRQMGFNLPLKYRPPKQERTSHRRCQWTAQQLAELEKCGAKTEPRITAVLRVGTEVSNSINQIARECSVPAGTVRLDLKRFLNGGAKALISHRRQQNILLRKGAWKSFTAWCQNQYQQSGKCPSAATAAQYLFRTHQVRMPIRTVYTHLTCWRRDQGIALRKRRPLEKLKPSQGIVVRTFRL